jgi:hypothetical protein
MIPAEKLGEQRDITPYQLVDFLWANRDIELYGLSDIDSNYFYTCRSKQIASGMLKNIKLHISDVKRNEECQRELEIMSKHTTLKTNNSRIDALEAELAESKKQLADIEGVRKWNKQFLTERDALRKALEEKAARIAELEKELAAAKAEPATTANAALWEGSVQAALSVWAQTVQGDKKDWKEQEFRKAVEKQGMGCHTKVFALAWGLLPDDFKHGPGRPKKTLKTSNILES